MRYLIPLSLTLFAVAGCSESSDPGTPEAAAPSEAAAGHDEHSGHAHDDSEATGTAARDTAYAALASSFEPITSQWGDLQGLAEQLGNALSGDQKELIDGLREEYDSVLSQLGELKTASGSAWGDLNSTLETSMNELRSALSTAIDEIRSATPTLPSLPNGLGGG